MIKRAVYSLIDFSSLVIKMIVIISILALAAKGITASINESKSNLNSPHYALITLSGEIAAGRSFSSEKVNPLLIEALDSEVVKGIVIKVNSPGGSPVQAGRIYDQIVRGRESHPEKKIIVVVDDICASGCYYIASAASEIYADKASIIGSIGVISSSFGFKGILDKVGIEHRTITAGEHKAFLDPYSELNPNEVEHWKKLLGKTHKQFIEAVTTGRGDQLKVGKESGIFDGLMWNGVDSMEMGMIDGLGDENTAALESLGELKLLEYRPEESFIESIRKATKEGVTSSAAEYVESYIDDTSKERFAMMMIAKKLNLK